MIVASKKKAPKKNHRRTREHPNLAIMRGLVEQRTFSSLASGPGGSGPEYMLRVSWSGAFDNDDAGRGHHVRRGEVTLNLGLDEPPNFTDRDMQDIAFAAKMAAITCLRRRKEGAKPEAKRCP
jgi:hypothetical protein